MAMVRAAFGFFLKLAFKFAGLAYLYAKVFSFGIFVGFEDGSSFHPSLGTCLGFHQNPSRSENRWLGLRDGSSYETKTELDRYLREPKIELRKGQSLDILQWWKVNGPRFPIVSKMARGYASILINGSPTKEFKIERGLRQGDPLSPFLFILAMEALNVAILKAQTLDIFRGAEVGIDKVPISHLQFADDALIIGEWSTFNVQNLSRILTCFHLASGLKVNFNKSKLFGLGVPFNEFVRLPL
ncbi:putative RNA-directed DNA polymerase, eukaryota, reverse transcriptase zinc-binding domain protein [Tanacetum coccineum]